MEIEKASFWPDWFCLALPVEQQAKIEPSMLLKLRRANRYLWRALNIYDDFLDQEAQSAQLPLANGYYRRFLEIYYSLDLPAAFYRLFRNVMDDLDITNRQEVQKHRLPIKNGQLTPTQKIPSFANLIDLSRKSLPLGLGAIALLYRIKPESKKTEITATLNFFRCALAAKQLADDARDWFDDLKDGRLTAANVLVLRAAKRYRLPLDLRRQPEIFYLLFAQEASKKITADLSSLCRKTKKAAIRSHLALDCRLLTEIIGPLETGLAEVNQFRSYWLKNP